MQEFYVSHTHTHTHTTDKSLKFLLRGERDIKRPSTPIRPCIHNTKHKHNHKQQNSIKLLNFAQAFLLDLCFLLFLAALSLNFSASL